MGRWPARKLRVNSLVIATGVIFSVFICATIYWVSDFSKSLDNFFSDKLAAFAVREYQSTPVRIIDIDDRSLAKLGQWPWSRNQLARLTDRLQDLGAAAIAYDFLFSEPDRTSPSVLIAGLPRPIGALLARLPALDYDTAFAESLAHSPSVLPVGLVSKPNGARLGKAMPLAVLGNDPLAQLPHYDGVIASLPVLQQAAPGLATFSFAADDRIVRAVPLLSVFDNQVVPSLSLEALRIAAGGGTIAIKERLVDGEPRLAIRVGHRTLQVGLDGMMRLHYAGHRPERVISAADLMIDPIPDELTKTLKGAIVLIGTSAVGLSDLRPTPVDPYLPGVEIHAEAIEHMLLGIAPQRPAWVIRSEIAATLAAGLLATLITLLLGGIVGLLFVGGLTVSGIALAFWGFTTQELLVNPLPAVLISVLTTVLIAFLRHAVVDRNGRWLKRAFGQYLSPELVEQLARDPQAIALGGETRHITCLFTDLEGFTALSERLPPPALVDVMNSYLDGICQVAKSNGGTVLKIIGDSVHVVFNAPMDQPDHPQRALACALDCHAFSEDFRRRQAAVGRMVGRTRIGIATGPAVVGNFGGATRFDYTAYGDTVNTAARLEAANKTLGSLILMTERTAMLATDPAGAFSNRLRAVGAITVVGKHEPVAAVELITADVGAVDCAGFLAALAALGRDDGTGHLAMSAYAAAFPNDLVARLMLERLSRADHSVNEAGAITGSGG
jgi:adenylate cyclase